MCPSNFPSHVLLSTHGDSGEPVHVFCQADPKLCNQDLWMGAQASASSKSQQVIPMFRGAHEMREWSSGLGEAVRMEQKWRQMH